VRPRFDHLDPATETGEEIGLDEVWAAIEEVASRAELAAAEATVRHCLVINRQRVARQSRSPGDMAKASGQAGQSRLQGLGTPRFGRYLTAAGGDRVLALALYEWNAQISWTEATRRAMNGQWGR
jgi:hypothetical protein